MLWILQRYVKLNYYYILLCEFLFYYKKSFIYYILFDNYQILKYIFVKYIDILQKEFGDKYNQFLIESRGLIQLLYKTVPSPKE